MLGLGGRSFSVSFLPDKHPDNPLTHQQPPGNLQRQKWKERKENNLSFKRWEDGEMKALTREKLLLSVGGDGFSHHGTGSKAFVQWEKRVPGCEA